MKTNVDRVSLTLTNPTLTYPDPNPNPTLTNPDPNPNPPGAPDPRCTGLPSALRGTSGPTCRVGGSNSMKYYDGLFNKAAHRINFHLLKQLSSFQNKSPDKQIL